MPVPLDPAGNPELCPELARLLGVLDTAGVNPEPSTPLDWALSYAAKGIHVFPAERHLGVPLVTDWHREATTCPAIIERWWSRTGEGREGHEWRRADIGAAPSKSGHFVLSAHHDEGGIASLDELENRYGPWQALLDYYDRWGSRYLWFRGRAYTSHHKLGKGLHVLGAGYAVFLPPSYTPHQNFDVE